MKKIRERNQQKYFPEIGQKFERLTLVEILKPTENHPVKLYKCQCDCGNEVLIKTVARLFSGRTKSCGCYTKDRAKQMGLNNILKEGNSTENSLISSYRYAAKKRGLEFSIDNTKCKELFSGNCNYCGSVPFRVAHYKFHKNSFMFNGIDRKDNNKGYTIDNCVTCCTICNKAKNNLTEEQFKNWVMKIYNHFIENKGEFKP